MELKLLNPTVPFAKDVEETSNSIVNWLNCPELSPLERYAIANQLRVAAEKAIVSLSDDAIKYALRKSTEEDVNENLAAATAGIEFYHRGYSYIIVFQNNYNYAQNDENGRAWVAANRDYLEAKKLAQAHLKRRNGLQPTILAEHPKLQPTSTLVSVRFTGKKEIVKPTVSVEIEDAVIIEDDPEDSDSLLLEDGTQEAQNVNTENKDTYE